MSDLVVYEGRSLAFIPRTVSEGLVGAADALARQGHLVHGLERLDCDELHVDAPTFERFLEDLRLRRARQHNPLIDATFDGPLSILIAIWIAGAGPQDLDGFPEPVTRDLDALVRRLQG